MILKTTTAQSVATALDFINWRMQGMLNHHTEHQLPDEVHVGTLDAEEVETYWPSFVRFITERAETRIAEHEEIHRVGAEAFDTLNALMPGMLRKPKLDNCRHIDWIKAAISPESLSAARIIANAMLESIEDLSV